MARRLVTLLAVATLVGAGCADGGGGGGDEAEQLDIVLIQGVAGDEFYITMDCGAQQAAEELGVNYSVQGPNEFDPTEQIPIVEAVVAQQPDAILIAPTERTALIGPLQQAQDAGITVVLVDTIVDDPNIGVSRIATDNVEGGRVAGETLVELIGGEGTVFVNTTQPGVSTVEERQQGFEEVIEGEPGIEYLGAEYNNDDPTRAAQITSAVLADNPDLAGIFATNLFSAEGAATALRGAGPDRRLRCQSRPGGSARGGAGAGPGRPEPAGDRVPGGADGGGGAPRRGVRRGDHHPADRGHPGEPG